MDNYVEMAICLLYKNHTNTELVKQFNEKSNYDNSKEAYEIIRRKIPVQYREGELTLKHKKQ